MMTAYFDEAYDHGFTVVCGWISSVESWDNFEVDWKLFLIKHDIPYFHMKEFAHSRGPFAKWKDQPERRKHFLRDAWDIIESRVRRGFVCGVWDVLYNRINRSYRLKENFKSPYALAGREAMDWANRYARIAARDDVKCIFDHGGPDKGGLLRAADVAPKVSTPDFEPSRDIEDRKKGKRRGVVQIQAADFLAYELRKFIIDHPQFRTRQKNPRLSLQMFGTKKPDTKLMTEQRMEAICARYAVESRQ
jgi:hypothetical protein